MCVRNKISVLVVPWPEKNIKICFPDLLLLLYSGSFSNGMLQFSLANNRSLALVQCMFVFKLSDSLK